MAGRPRILALGVLNLPLIAAALGVLRHVPADTGTRRPLSVDLSGALLAVAGLGGVIYALTAAPKAGWTSAPVLSCGLFGEPVPPAAPPTSS